MSKIGPVKVVVPFKGGNQQRMARHTNAVEFCINTFGDIQLSHRDNDPPMRWWVASALTFCFFDPKDAVMFKLSLERNT